MAAISGRNGSVVINDGGDKTVGYTTDWSLDISMDTEEITAFGSAGWKDKMYMMSSWSGSMSCKFDMANTGQLAAQTKLITPGTVTIKLYVNATNYYDGTAYIKSISIKTPAGGIVEADISFEGTGAVAYH